MHSNMFEERSALVRIMFEKRSTIRLRKNSHAKYDQKFKAQVVAASQDRMSTRGIQHTQEIRTEIINIYRRTGYEYRENTAIFDNYLTHNVLSKTWCVTLDTLGICYQTLMRWTGKNRGPARVRGQPP